MPAPLGNSRFENTNDNLRAAGQGSAENLLAGGQGGCGRRAHRRTQKDPQPLHRQPAQLQYGGLSGHRTHLRPLHAAGQVRREALI